MKHETQKGNTSCIKDKDKIVFFNKMDLKKDIFESLQ